MKREMEKKLKKIMAWLLSVEAVRSLFRFTHKKTHDIRSSEEIRRVVKIIFRLILVVLLFFLVYKFVFLIFDHWKISLGVLIVFNWIFWTVGESANKSNRYLYKFMRGNRKKSHKYFKFEKE